MLEFQDFLWNPAKGRNRLVPIELMAKHYWFIIRILLLICHNIFICSRSNVNDDLWSGNGWNEKCLYPSCVTTATGGKDWQLTLRLDQFVSLCQPFSPWPRMLEIRQWRYFANRDRYSKGKRQKYFMCSKKIASDFRRKGSWSFIKL